MEYKYNHTLINIQSSTFLLIFPPPHTTLLIYSVPKGQFYFQSLEGGKNWTVGFVYNHCWSSLPCITAEGCLPSSDGSALLPLLVQSLMGHRGVSFISLPVTALLAQSLPQETVSISCFS